MVVRFRIVVVDFRTPYKGNNFHNYTDESVKLESLHMYTLSCGPKLESREHAALDLC